MSAFKPGDVVRYRSDRPDSWCREGMAIMSPWGEGARLIDTYWGRFDQDSHFLTDAEIATAELVFNLADYDELDRFNRGSSGQWAKYAPADREVVTSQHRLQNRWFIRKGASEDIETQIGNAEAKVVEAESAVQSAERHLAWAREHLATVGQHYDQIPMRRAAAEALVAAGSSFGSFIVAGGKVYNSSHDADKISEVLGGRA